MKLLWLVLSSVALGLWCSTVHRWRHWHTEQHPFLTLSGPATQHITECARCNQVVALRMELQ
jgi:disulfide bond formation protein DsbB